MDVTTAGMQYHMAIGLTSLTLAYLSALACAALVWRWYAAAHNAPAVQTSRGLAHRDRMCFLIGLILAFAGQAWGEFIVWRGHRFHGTSFTGYADHRLLSDIVVIVGAVIVIRALSRTAWGETGWLWAAFFALVLAFFNLVTWS